MRVLFATFASKSHMQILVPMAWALHTAGHEVRFASQPDLADEITKSGLTAVCVGEPLNLEENIEGVNENVGDDANREQSEADVGLDMSETRPERLTPEYMLTVFTVMTSLVFQNECPESMADDLVTFCREWQPDLVVWDTMTFAAPVAAKACGAAHARLIFGLDLVGHMRAAFLEALDAQPPEVRDDPLGEWLDYTAGRFGVDFDETLVTGQWTIDPMPQALRLPVPDLHYVPVRFVPFHGQSTIPKWLHEAPKRRRVCLTLGLSHREVRGGDKASIADLLESVADLDVEVVATLNAEQLKNVPNLPENVRAVDFVPLDALLPSCSAVIHQGGSGTTSTAVAHGVPQLIVPTMMWDTYNRAQGLEEYGAGLYLRDTANIFSSGELRAGLIRLLEEPSFAENATRLRQEQLGTPSPNDIVPLLEKLTAEHRAARR
ncbi:activator-dependent family glycosyltransferase [Spirillospora sp. NPDC047279]|uniref:activator-dependent family glycosyltransferase n=1 Tax=Spirillospora sp. NPDC047279 TaxID=3155478 RepID=UPI0033CC5DB3